MSNFEDLMFDSVFNNKMSDDELSSVIFEQLKKKKVNYERIKNIIKKMDEKLEQELEIIEVQAMERERAREAEFKYNSERLEALIKKSNEPKKE